MDLDYLYLDDVYAILYDGSKEIASWSYYNGGHIEGRKISGPDYQEFKEFVEKSTGRKLEWKWDVMYQTDFPYLGEAV